MAIFGKRKEEDYEYDDEEELIEEEREDRKLTKKFRDLNSKNKRKRKEPAKPWARKERMIVLITILVTALIAGILAFSSENVAQFSFSQINLNFPKLDFGSLNPFKEETIIIQKK